MNGDKEMKLDDRGRGFLGKHNADKWYRRRESHDGTIVLTPLSGPTNRRPERRSQGPDPDVTAALAEVGRQLGHVAELLTERNTRGR